MNTETKHVSNEKGLLKNGNLKKTTQLKSEIIGISGKLYVEERVAKPKSSQWVGEQGVVKTQTLLRATRDMK